MGQIREFKKLFSAWRVLHVWGYDTPELYAQMLAKRAETIRSVGMRQYVPSMLGVAREINASSTTLIDSCGNEIHPSENCATLSEYLISNFDEDSLPVLVRFRAVELAL